MIPKRISHQAATFLYVRLIYIYVHLNYYNILIINLNVTLTNSASR